MIDNANRDLIGKRLAMLRDELGGPGEDAWTQDRLADATGLTRNMIARLEQSCSGSIESCMTLLIFYHQRGYNLSWIVLPDNSSVSKMAISDASKAVDVQLVRSKLQELREILDKDVVEVLECLTE
ncbi:MAG: XRE family transcriptional regulator [Hymenobacter sp.]|nr:MAG: XRE family transcriptional regulator [Hymenobacter sp.]